MKMKIWQIFGKDFRLYIYIDFNIQLSIARRNNVSFRWFKSTKRNLIFVLVQRLEKKKKKICRSKRWHVCAREFLGERDTTRRNVRYDRVCEQTTPGWGPLASDLAFSVSLSKSSSPSRRPRTANSPPPPSGATLRHRSRPRSSSRPPHALLFAPLLARIEIHARSLAPSSQTSVESSRNSVNSKWNLRRRLNSLEFNTIVWKWRNESSSLPIFHNIFHKDGDICLSNNSVNSKWNLRCLLN